MVSKKIVVSLCIGLVLASGCSRQQSDWQKTRETNTSDAYELFLKKYPSGEFTTQAQARVKELYEERDWLKARDADTPEAYQAFVKQYPEGKRTEEARIRVENFTLAQAPGSSPAASDATTAENSTPSETAPPPMPAPPATTAALPAPVTATSPRAASTSQSVKSPPVVARAAPSAPATNAGPSPHQAAATNGKGQYGIQLGAFKADRSAADKRWARLQKQYPSMLAGLSSTVLPKASATGNWYRLQAFGLTEKHARSICSSLKAQSEACLVVRPASG